MTDKTFEKGMGMLLSVFQDKQINVKLFWELLKDIDDTMFLKAIKEICLTVKELYPNTNLVAMIREKAISKPKNKCCMCQKDIKSGVICAECKKLKEKTNENHN